MTECEAILSNTHKKCTQKGLYKKDGHKVCKTHQRLNEVNFLDNDEEEKKKKREEEDRRYAEQLQQELEREERAIRLREIMLGLLYPNVDFTGQTIDNIDFSRSSVKTDFKKTKKYICKGKENDNCTICLLEKEKGEECRRLVCEHSFHLDCIDPWLKKNPTCPLCREKN